MDNERDIVIIDIAELESTLDNCFCALQDHMRDHMKASEYRSMNNAFGAVSDIIAETLQEMRNVQPAEKARDRRENLDLLQTIYRKIRMDLLEHGMQTDSAKWLDHNFETICADIRLSIFTLERKVK